MKMALQQHLDISRKPFPKPRLYWVGQKFLKGWHWASFHIHVFFGKMSKIFNWVVFLLQENLKEVFYQPNRIYRYFFLASTVVELFCSRTFSSRQQKPHINNHCSTLTLHSAPGHTDLLFVSVDLPDLELLFKWNHTKYGLLCLASLAEHIVLKICPWWSVCQYFIPFHE